MMIFMCAQSEYLFALRSIIFDVKHYLKKFVTNVHEKEKKQRSRYMRAFLNLICYYNYI